MASQFLISPLPLEEQAALLRELLSTKNLTLSLDQALEACTALGLATGGDKTELARKLVAELRGRSLKTNHAFCVELVAKLCGGDSWMRLRQKLLTEAVEAGELAVYGVQLASLSDGDPGRVLTCESMADAATLILNFVGKIWPKEVVPSLGNFLLSQAMLALELEHPTHPWLTFRVMKVSRSEGEVEPLEFDDKEARNFCARLQRGLEFSHPGLLVMGVERSASLPFTYVLLPKLQQPTTGFDFVCRAPMELYMWLGSFELEYPTSPTPSGILPAKNGPVLFIPRWVNGMDGTEKVEPEDSLAEDLAKRLLRLQRTTGMTLTQFLTNIFSGAGQATAAHTFNRERFIEAMTAANLTVGDVATRCALTVNDVLRAQKYGYATSAVLQKLADAVGMTSPNELLRNDEQSSIGIRVEAGDVFLRGLKDSHAWRIVMGQTLVGKELEVAQAIAESLKEYVDLYQFAKEPMDHGGLGNLEPVDEATIAGHIQEQLDELRKMGLVVLIGRGLQYVNVNGDADQSAPIPMLTGTICVEREALLRKPDGFKVHSE